MTRIFTDGAEMDDLLFWDIAAPAEVVLKSSVPDPYDGEFYYHNKGNYYCRKTFTAISECYFRVRVYLPSNVMSWYNSYCPMFLSNGNDLAYLGGDGNGHWSALMGSSSSPTLLEDSGVAMSIGQWYLVEVHFKLANSPNGIFQVKIDGTQIINFTGDTLINNAYSSFDTVNVGVAGGIYIDDLALNDVNGGVDDSWCGDGSVVKVYPNGNGAHNNWHGSDGNDVNNFELVDEFPNDGDTTYVSHDSSSSGTQDQYAMSDYDGTGKTIDRIYAEARARLTAPSANTLKLGVLPSGSTDQMSAGRALTVGAYKRVVGNEYKTNPADAAAWEEADIDAIEGVIEVG